VLVSNIITRIPGLQCEATATRILQINPGSGTELGRWISSMAAYPAGGGTETGFLNRFGILQDIKG